ncbi:MAG: hypothetical protein KA224_02060 [Steroidobacteraceae bacterium]|nr:hypothetical protein [Steroidobacteraceae bacterium]
MGIMTRMAEDAVAKRLFGKAPAKPERRLLADVSSGEKDFWRRAIAAEKERVAAGVPSPDDDLGEDHKPMN